MKLSDRERDILDRWPTATDRDIEQMNDGFAHYLFFRRRKDGGAEYHASCCGHREQIEGARRTEWPWENELLAQSRHNAEGVCPWCGRTVTMKDLARAGKRKGLAEWRCVMLLHQRDGALYADALVLRKDYETEDSLTARPEYRTDSGYRFAVGEVMQAEHGYGRTPYVTWETGRLGRRKLVQEPFKIGCCGYYRHEPYRILNREALEESTLRYCQFFGGWQYRPGGGRGYADGYSGFVNYMTAYCIYPRQIEMLVRAGLYQPVSALVWERKKFAGAICWEEPDIRKAMGLTREQLRQVVAVQPDFGALECRNYANRNLDAGWGIEDAAEYWQMMFGESYAMEGLRLCRRYRLGVNRVIRYLTAQAERAGETRFWAMYELYRDYLDAAYACGWCMEHGKVRYPEDLPAAHDTAVEQWAAAQEEQTEQEDLRRFRDARGRKEKYEFELDGWRIVFPLSSGAIKREGAALNHCVGGYAERHIRGVLSIVFLRRAATPHVPYVTIEMDGNRIRQIHGANNDRSDRTGPRERHREFLDTWLGWLRAGSPRNEDGTPKLPRRKAREKAERGEIA